MIYVLLVIIAALCGFIWHLGKRLNNAAATESFWRVLQQTTLRRWAEQNAELRSGLTGVINNLDTVAIYHANEHTEVGVCILGAVQVAHRLRDEVLS